MKRNNIFQNLILLTFVITFLIACKDDNPVPQASTIADFQYEATNNLTAPSTVKFTNRSILATSYLWDFGNGSTSAEMEPEVTFSEPGSYNVSLTVGATNEVYYNKLTKTVALQVKDPTAGKTKTLYFTDRTTHSVRYAVLDDNAPVVQDFGHTGLDKPYGMAIDTANARVIVSDYRAGVIYSYDLEGFDLQIVIDYNNPVLIDPFGLEIVGDKLYWGTQEAIGRCNFDGSEAEVFIPLSLATPPEMAIDLAWDYIGEKFIFTNDKYEFTGGMYSVDFNGNTFTELVPGTNGGAMALDVENNKMYYADFDKGICVANLDGSDEIVIAAEMIGIFCWGMDVDLDAGKIYWSDKTNLKIVRANLDGSEKEDFITDCNPYAIAIDMYR
ncbi:MAG: PKD domain-containing protein [Bacteroidales bacterium]|nr:PKD domain-containing protein [Bacteroidales bacterium]